MRARPVACILMMSYTCDTLDGDDARPVRGHLDRAEPVVHPASHLGGDGSSAPASVLAQHALISTLPRLSTAVIHRCLRHGGEESEHDR